MPAFTFGLQRQNAAFRLTETRTSLCLLSSVTSSFSRGSRDAHAVKPSEKPAIIRSAIRAHVPGGLSIEEIEEKIRGIQAIHAREQD